MRTGEGAGNDLDGILPVGIRRVPHLRRFKAGATRGRTPKTQVQNRHLGHPRIPSSHFATSHGRRAGGGGGKADGRLSLVIDTPLYTNCPPDTGLRS